MRYTFPHIEIKKITRTKRLWIIVGGVLGLMVVYMLFAQHSAARFNTAYSAYAVLAEKQENAAYLPAAPNNPVRQQLNLALSETLQTAITSPKRLTVAKQGLSLLTELDAQVDDIGSTSEKANAALAKLQVGSLGDFTTTGGTHELVDLAKQRSSLIEDIRGLSYRADFETRKIFDRVVADNGALTSTHISDLNNQIPEIETQFDRRTSLYTQLQSLSLAISQKASTVVSSKF